VIVPFAIDSEALAFSAGSDIAAHLAVHRRLLNTWRSVGVLVHGGDRFAQSELARHVSDLPQQVKVLWQKALKTHRLLGAGASWTPLSSFTTQAELALVRDRFDVGCLDDTRAVCLEIPLDKVSVTIDGQGPEICRWSLADQADSFVRALAAAEVPIPRGEPVDKIWRERFLPSAQLCRKSVAIIDRYAVSNHIQGRGGLARFLSECERVLQGRTVTLFTAYGDDCTKLEVIASVRSLAATLKTSGIRQVELYVGYQGLFGTDAHYRCVRFDSTIIELDIGLGVLAGPAAYAHCKHRMRAMTQEDSSEETRLRSLMAREVIPCS
jgi:hypothetical protein